MFEKYNINDLFLARIKTSYPGNDDWDISIGGILIMSTANYGYMTILKKEEDKYIDLQNIDRQINLNDTLENSKYVIDYIEPLNNYYTQEGKKKVNFSRKKALTEAKKYYKELQKNHCKQEQTK